MNAINEEVENSNEIASKVIAEKVTKENKKDTITENITIKQLLDRIEKLEEEVSLLKKAKEDIAITIQKKESQKDNSSELAAETDSKDEITEKEFREGEQYWNKRDYAEAVKHYSIAASNGHKQAKDVLGNYYVRLAETAKSKESELEYYKEASNYGSAVATLHVANIYYAGNETVERNLEEAVKWYIKASKEGSIEAKCMLGECYYNGQGVAADSKLALDWYKQAATAGNAKAQFGMGRCYYLGHGVDKNEQEGIRWYVKSANQKYAPAKEFLKENNLR